jgi:phage FluMu protein Com
VIYELEVLQARARATSYLKGKERACKSLNQGKSLTAIKALDSIKKKREEANEELRKVSREARIDLNKKKNALRKRGV